jgi:hypothetical protein
LTLVGNRYCARGFARHCLLGLRLRLLREAVLQGCYQIDELGGSAIARGVVARAFVVASTRFSLEPLTRPHELRRVKMVKSTSSSGTHQSSFDRNRIAEEVENGAVGVNRRGQFLISSSVLWPT